MFVFLNKQIDIAGSTDISAIKDLLNSAYRGESSKEGWTSEAHLIAGNVRTDELTVKKTMQQPGSVFLKYTTAKNEIIGCVNLQKHRDRMYLGMFSVSPKLQGGGVGKQILQASEEYAKHLRCTSIYMSVISVRTELIQWYQRHGYHDTGNRQRFVEDAVSGKHLQDLEFLVLEKFLQ